MWATLKKLAWEWRGVCIATPSITVAVILIRFTGILQSLEWAAFDQYMRLRPLASPGERVAIVGINETDVQKLGQANFSDRVLVQLLEKLKAQQPRAIGLDLYRDQPVEPGHEELVKLFTSTPNLIGIEKVGGEQEGEGVAPPPALAAEGRVGANDVIIDADGKVRRSLFFVWDREGERVPSFGLYLALLYLEAEGIAPELAQGASGGLQLGDTVFPPFESNDGGYVRGDAGGYQIILNYRGPSQHFETVSMMDILEDRVSSDWGRDRVILIGRVGESFKDLFLTPHSSSLLQLPERMAGVEIHANLASQIISATLNDRPLIQTWAEPWEWVWIFLWSGMGATIAWKLRYTGGVQFLSLQRVASPIMAGGALFGCTYVAFLQGWWIPVVPPAIALVGSVVAIVGYVARTAEDIRKTFGRYISDRVVANLLESPEGLRLGGERRKITILTSDIRGFTNISERLPAEKVIEIINLYLAEMAEVITHYEGTIDEFMGDGILVLFGAPTAREDDPTRAVACAVAMQLAMASVNQKLKKYDFPPLEMGIGINTGEVVVGNIGSEKRTKYGVVGNQVNLTYRIESYTIGGQILISESTLKEAGSDLKIAGQKQVNPKGVKEPITIYEIEGIGGQYNLFLSHEEETFFPLPEAIPVQYSVLDGKDINNNSLFEGSLVKLSKRGGQVRSRQEIDSAHLPHLSNIRLIFLSPDSPDETSDDIYAKVAGKSLEDGYFYIHFTAKPPAVQQQLDALYDAIEKD